MFVRRGVCLRDVERNRGVHAHSCIMGNLGKRAGNLKICIGIQSHLILPEFIYLMLSLFEKSNLQVQRNNTLNLECKEVRDQFLENLDFSKHFL